MHKIIYSVLLGCGLTFASISMAMAASSAPTKHEKLTPIYTFQGGADGDVPLSLVQDSSGDLYGITSLGGSTNCLQGCGTIFKITPDGTKTIIYMFTGNPDGASPTGIIRATDGTIYGTTMAGGAHNYGTVFKLTADGQESVLYSFDINQFANGFRPALNAGLAIGADGNLYGTTAYGGNGICVQGCGTVFKITPQGELTTLHAFTGPSNNDGWRPESTLTTDNAGNLFGTTFAGGTINNGLIYKIDAGGNYSVVHVFGKHEGAQPLTSPVVDAAGNLYGGTTAGPNRGCEEFGCGVIYKIATDGTYTILFSTKVGRQFFGGKFFGVSSQLIMDKHGVVYGTTFQGGAQLTCDADLGCGTVFELTPDGKRKSLHIFEGPAQNDGIFPWSLIQGVDAEGRATMFGATQYGPNCDNGCGMVFKIKR